jgi:homoserine dehydrogenase
MPTTPSNDGPLRVAILGLGTVGGAVARALLERPAELAAVAGGRQLRLVAVGVRNPGRDRGLSLSSDVQRTDALADLAGEAPIDVLVELLGGLEPAGGLVATALGRGTAVVTANKALLAARGVALETLARRTGATLRFEAAVGAGIPVLGPLGGALAANRWSALAGIVNGTTNQILGAMADGRSYEEALAEAQRLGYAEADPSGDVEGRDAADKLAILCRLAFGGWPPVEAIERRPPSLRGTGSPGITGVRASEIDAARRSGWTVKLLAEARRVDGGIAASVLPTAVPGDSPFGRTAGVENRIELVGEPIGHVSFSGPGAGGPATSSAILGDLIAVARGEGSTWAGLPPAGRIELVTDESTPRPWFWVGELHGYLVAPATAAQVRADATETSFDATLYPVLEAG